jgi:predicted RNA binding protein YcfA (HicA-like mRNA interferase family)
MPLRPLPFREVKHRLEAAGFTEVSSKGSHVKFAKFAGEDTWIVIVPHHTEVSIGTLRSILRQANLSVEEFSALAKH